LLYHCAERARVWLTAVALAMSICLPALAADEPKKGTDADDEFMLGLRKVGVMAGEAYTCSPEADRPGIGADALELANQVALHFGLKPAFVFSGAFGYGSGHEFDKATCPGTLENFKAIRAKYLPK
jgi:hypothetical protein